MTEALLTGQHMDRLIEVVYDEDPESPDSMDDNGVFILAWHRQFCVTREGFEDKDSVADWAEEYEVFPLYAYIHSGVALSLGCTAYPFNDRWDSCQVGYVLVGKDVGWGRPLEEIAAGQVETWNQYLSGGVLGYETKDRDGEVVDSCWGFYTTPEQVLEEAKQNCPTAEWD